MVCAHIGFAFASKIKCSETRVFDFVNVDGPMGVIGSTGVQAHRARHFLLWGIFEPIGSSSMCVHVEMITCLYMDKLI